jgi:phosphopantothenoylcysteine decarboxylase / phosphopantothenate---cysteine ligase
MKNHIVIGVTGGIASYKSLDLISNLKKLGNDITVILTRNAAEFVNPITFQTISQNKVITDMFDLPNNYEVEHISIGKKADLFIIVPATANIIGKIANGIADDFLTTAIMATKKPVLFVPSMNTNMYENPIYVENANKLKALGYFFMEPDDGLLACGDVGKGKLPDTKSITEFALSVLEKVSGIKQDLIGKNILVTAGPTIEDIDPIRFISNNSSGKMGFAIAEEALARGARVTLIAGPVDLVCSQGIKRINVRSTEEMANAVTENFENNNAVIMAAAPSDYRVEKPSKSKMKKTNEDIKISLIENRDIIGELGKRKGDKILIGFAAETNNVLEYATEKIKKKNLDYIIANDVSKAGAGFNSDTNIISIIGSNGSIKNYDIMTKSLAAKVILDLLADK